MASWMAKIVPPTTAAVKIITTMTLGTRRHISFTIIPVKCKMSLMPESEIPVYVPPQNKPLVLVLVGLMVLILLFSASFWLGKGKSLPPKPEAVDPGQVLADRFGQPATVPGQITFIFFNDANRNGVFDQNESSYSNVSVEFRRRGQEGPFQTIPADTLGKVVVSGLAPADYEVRYWFADFDQGPSYGDFNIRNWYEIVTPTGGIKSFPSDWESLPDEIEIKVGVAEYIPDKLIVGQTQNQLFLVDPTKPNFSYGESNIFHHDGLWYRFTLVGDKVYYLANNELRFFDVKNRLTQTAIKPAYGIDNFNYRLSLDTKTLIYIDNGELSYITRDDWCGQGAIFDSEGYRLLTQTLTVNFRDSQQFVALAQTSNNNSQKVYLIGCRDGRLEGFVTDWAVDTVAPEPAPVSWQEGGFKLDILLGVIDL